MRSARSTGRLFDERGVTWVTVALLLALALGGYLGCVWVPVYFVHYEVRQVVRDYGNQAVKDPDDAALVAKMVHKLRVLDEQTIVDDDGRTTKVPVIQVDPNEVVWERSGEPPALHVAFDYVREIRYPLIDRSTEKVFHVDLTMDISRPDWGPAR